MDRILRSITPELSGCARASRPPSSGLLRCPCPTAGQCLRLPPVSGADCRQVALETGSALTWQRQQPRSPGRAGTAPGPGSTRGSAVPTRSGRRQRAGLARFISPPPHHLGALSFLQQNPWLLSSGVQPPVSPASAALGRTEQGCWVSHSEVPTLPEHWMAFTVQPPNPRCFTAGHAASQIKLSWARQVEEKSMCLTPKTGLVAHTG